MTIIHKHANIFHSIVQYNNTRMNLLRRPNLHWVCNDKSGSSRL